MFKINDKELMAIDKAAKLDCRTRASFVRYVALKEAKRMLENES